MSSDISFKILERMVFCDSCVANFIVFNAMGHLYCMRVTDFKTLVLIVLDILYYC